MLISALLLLRIKFDIYLNEDIVIKLNILGFKKQLYPEKVKKVSIKKFKKAPPKKATVATTDSRKTEKRESKGESIPLSDKISTVTHLVKVLFSSFFKHLRLDVSKIIVIVGGKVAAAAAINYGIISQSVAYLLEFLDNNLNVHKNRKGEINVLCDFTNEKTVYDVFISASLNAWQIIDIAITLVYNYFNGIDIFNLKNKLPKGDKTNGRK